MSCYFCFQWFHFETRCNWSFCWYWIYWWNFWLSLFTLFSWSEFKCVATIYQLIVKQTIPWIFTEFNTSNNALMSVSNSSFFFIRRFMFSVEADILRKKNWRIRFDQRPNQKMKIWTRHGTLIFSMWQKTNFK